MLILSYEEFIVFVAIWTLQFSLVSGRMPEIAKYIHCCCCFYTTHIHLKDLQIHKYKHKYIHCCCCCTTHIKLKDLELHKYKHKYTHYSCYIKCILYFPFSIFQFKRLFKFCRHLYMVVNISYRIQIRFCLILKL